MEDPCLASGLFGRWRRDEVLDVREFVSGRRFGFPVAIWRRATGGTAVSSARRPCCRRGAFGVRVLVWVTSCSRCEVRCHLVQVCGRRAV